MTNYEKYKSYFIKMLIGNIGTCSKIRKVRMCSEYAECPLCSLHNGYELCKECESLNEQWLNEEVEVFNPSELKAGDKIVMRKNGDCYTYECEVLGNSLHMLWLKSRNNNQQQDSGFLISHKDMLEHFVIEEVSI